MTRLEKAKELRPHYTEENIISSFCPNGILPMKFDFDFCNSGEVGPDHCKECWNKPYETEEKK